MKPNVPGKIIADTSKATNKLWNKPKNCCYCERSLLPGEITKEHLIPRHAGGSFIAPCCKACNEAKWDKTLFDWIIELWDEQRKTVDRKQSRIIELRIRNATKYLLVLYPGEYEFIFG